jgi:two-component system chemotaxis response regulator CheB
MSGLLERLVRKPAGEPVSIPDDLKMEVKVSELFSGAIAPEVMRGEPAQFPCPECGGPLWETDRGGIRRYRCMVGHALGGESLLQGQSEKIDRALWEAVRQLEERTTLLTPTLAMSSSLKQFFSRFSANPSPHRLPPLC